MIDVERQDRHRAITAAAYRLLEAKGYGGTSMLRVARAARASNETLYRWYGDKNGLFAAMVEDNAAEVRRVIESALDQDSDPMETLARAAPILLDLLLGNRAILLNRAAAADPSGDLGRALSSGARAAVMPQLQRLMVRIGARTGTPAGGTSGAGAGTSAGPGQQMAPTAMASTFLGLLVGDLQIRQVIHDLGPLTEAEIAARAAQALATFRRIVEG